MSASLGIRTVAIFLLTCSLLSVAARAEFRRSPAETTQLSFAKTVTSGLDTFYRTELYFGRSKPGGGIVTDEEWEKFLAEIVTPRFPDGFTILKATGQYREKTGKIISEPSMVLVFLYPRKTRAVNRSKIEEIRTAYVKRFNQESVMRMDLRQTVRVFF